jgi:beta-glucosidase
VQSVPGILSNADDFVLNNQETNRYGGNSVCDERTRWELYYRAYQGAVDAEVASVMCSYNRINGTYACENSVTLGDLKSPSGLNFSGWVLSDWEGTHSTVAAANAGLDQEMGWSIYFFDSALEKAVANGEVSEARFDDMVMRILVQMFKFGLFDVPADPARNQNANATSPEHDALARKLAAAGTVLLQNRGCLLPLSDASPPRSILVLGDSGDKAPQCCPDDQGSGDVTPPYLVSPLQGIRARASATTAVSYLPSSAGAQPLTQYYSASRRLHYLAYDCLGCPKGGVYAPERVEGFALQDDCRASLPGECAELAIFYNAATGANLVAPADFPPPAGFALWAGGVAGYALPLNYSGSAPTAVLELWTDQRDFFTLASNASRAEAEAANLTKAADLARILLNQTDPRNPDPTIAAAAAADVVVRCVAMHSDEGSDRPDLFLTPKDAAMAAAVTAVQPRTIVALNNPGAVVMPWADAAGAIIASWYSGQEMGNALADILWGDVNPSGRTPVTWPMADETPMGTPQQWPGVGGVCEYSERLEIGYRWWDAHNATPRFAFGHGESYTVFAYADLSIDSTSAAPNVVVSWTVANSGARDGKEVAQLYVAFPAAAGEPPWQLRGVRALQLAAGGGPTAANVTLTPRDLSIWDVGAHAWALQHGGFGVAVGASSRDFRLQGTFTI